MIGWSITGSRARDEIVGERTGISPPGSFEPITAGKSVNHSVIQPSHFYTCKSCLHISSYQPPLAASLFGNVGSKEF